jgi:hypothetical protein
MNFYWSSSAKRLEYYNSREYVTASASPNANLEMNLHNEFR